MIKSIFILFWMLLYGSLTGQFGINPIIVNRIHSDESPFISVMPIRWVHAFGGGIEVYKKGFPFTASITRDYYFRLDNYNAALPVRAFDIDFRWHETFMMLNYRFNKNFVSAGLFRQEIEASQNLLNDNFNESLSGIVVSFTRSFKWLDIEYKSKINIEPLLAAILGSNPHSISLNYRLGNYEKEIRESKQGEFEKNLELSVILGGRMFDASSIELLQFEKEYHLGFKPMIGIEVLGKKSNWGFFIEKDIWMTFNAGSQFRQIKDQIINNSIGLRYVVRSAKLNDVRFSLGLNFIRDSEVLRAIDFENRVLHEKLISNQMRGVLLGINWEIFKNTDLEIRHTIPYISRNEKVVEPKRFSLGLSYRYDPFDNQ